MSHRGWNAIGNPEFYRKLHQYNSQVTLLIGPELAWQEVLLGSPHACQSSFISLKSIVKLHSVVKLCICFLSCMWGPVVSSVLSLRKPLRYKLKHLLEIKSKPQQWTLTFEGWIWNRDLFMCAFCWSAWGKLVQQISIN